MKKLNKSIFLTIGLIGCSTLLCGGVFATVVVEDNAPAEGIHIEVEDREFYVNSVSNENKLTNNHDGTWSTANINAAFNATYQIVDELGANVGSSYTTTTDGTYRFTYDYLHDTTITTVISKYVYFNFLPMANGNQAGRVWNRFFCYAWNNEDGSINNGEYTGVEMEAVNSNGLYRASLLGDYDRVIFNNGETTQDHKIKTDDLTVNIATPQFACNANFSVQSVAKNADPAPTLNTTLSYDYYLYYKRADSENWVNMDRAFGFERTEETGYTQYLLRCYFNANDMFVINNGNGGWWNSNNFKTSADFVTKDGDNIKILTAGFYNIYFKASAHEIYMD